MFTKILSRLSGKGKRERNDNYRRKTTNVLHSFFEKTLPSAIMILRLWQNMQLVQNTLSDHNTYRMYSDIVTGGEKNDS